MSSAYKWVRVSCEKDDLNCNETNSAVVEIAVSVMEKSKFLWIKVKRDPIRVWQKIFS